ncbi:hypothetical protein ABZY03_24665 [Streptomyces klenkii]
MPDQPDRGGGTGATRLPGSNPEGNDGNKQLLVFGKGRFGKD